MEQFRCPVCQAEFSTNEQLDRHMRQHDERHAGTRSPADYSCPRCGAEFSTREELDRHGRAQHPTG